MNGSSPEVSQGGGVPLPPPYLSPGLWAKAVKAAVVVVPAAAAALYLVALAYRFPRILEALYWDSDVAFHPLLAEELPSLSAAGRVNMGNTPYFSTFWFLLATRSLPFHRLIWAAGPYLLVVAAVGLMAWSCRNAAGRWSGMLAFCIGIAASPLVLMTYMTPGFRVATWFSIALLVWFSVIMADRAGDRISGLLVAGAVAVSLVSATTVASDPLFLASGLGPFAGASLILWARDRVPAKRRQLILTACVAFASLALGTLISRWMNSLGFVATYPQKGFFFASEAEIYQNAATLLGDIVYMGNGWFFGQPLSLRSAGSLAAAVLSILGASVLWFVFRQVIRSQGSGAGVPTAVFQVLVFFWTLSAFGTTVAFVFSKIPAAAGLASVRYAVPLFFAVGAVVPLWAAGSARRRAIAAAGAALLALLGTANQPGLFVNLSENPLARQAPYLSEFLSKHGLSRGYAAYWHAHALSWNAGSAVRVYPVVECRRPESTVPCPFPAAARSDWYRPERDIKSFILTGPKMVGSLSRVPSEALGPPSLERRFGELTLFVYDYDVATKFFPAATP